MSKVTGKTFAMSKVKGTILKISVLISIYFSTDSAPVEKQWGELMKYNIFIMKIIEFVSSLTAHNLLILT